MLSPRLASLFFAFAAALSAAFAGEVQSPAPQPAGHVPRAVPPRTVNDEDAAAKHARRTACLKDARAHRLVGAQRTEFVKNCLENPTEPVSNGP